MSTTKTKSTRSKSSIPPGATAQPKSPNSPGGAAKPKKTTPATDARKRQNRIIGIVAVAVIAIVVVGVGWMFLSRPSGGVTAGTGGAAMASSKGTAQQGNGGSWTNVSVDSLAAMLAKKDFTLLNVKTPYIGEIEGTDAYIPYTDLTTRAAELPKDRTAPIVVYCRSGNESRIAAQTLLDLGYTDIINLDGGMNAWTTSGRTLVNKNRG